jgi:hypothetical protein
MKKFLFAIATVLLGGANAYAAAAQRARVDFTTAAGFQCTTRELGAACVSTDAKDNFFTFGGSLYPITVHNTATNSDIMFTESATGWVVPNDNTDDDGIEITFGSVANSPCAFTVGTSPAFYVKATFTIPDVSDYDVAAVGFRNDTATYVAVDDPADINTTTPAYSDFALINVNAGDFRTYTQDDDGTATDTNITTTAWADGEAHTLMVKVSSAGAVTYWVDGVNQATANGAVAFSLDSSATDIFVPTIMFAKGGTSSDTPPEMRLFECGLQ